MSLMTQAIPSTALPRALSLIGKSAWTRMVQSAGLAPSQYVLGMPPKMAAIRCFLAVGLLAGAMPQRPQASTQGTTSSQPCQLNLLWVADRWISEGRARSWQG